MKFVLELQHKDLNRVRFLIDNVEVSNQTVDNIWNSSLDLTKTLSIEVWFWPWQIKPILRINNHLVDYSLAKVKQFDHMLQWEISKDFFDQYHQRLIESRIKSQFGNNDFNQEIYDAVIGYGLDQKDLVQEIKSKINHGK